MLQILEIPWDYLRQEIKDRGSYLLVLKIEKEKLIEIGRLGKFWFQKGYYIYVGSAMNSLRARIERHRQKRKKSTGTSIILPRNLTVFFPFRSGPPKGRNVRLLRPFLQS